jgi:hypothetical protein
LEILLSPELGSAKFQLQPVTFPDVMVDKSEKQVESPKQTGTEVKFTVGSGFTTTVMVLVSLQPKLFVTVSVTV